MKKIIFAALVSSLFAIGAMAQSTSYIVSAGYQGAKLSGLDGAKMISGARAGVAVDFAVLNSGNMQLSVQPGLNFSMKGFSLNDKETVKSSFYYIDLPILANLRFDVQNDLNAFVNAGPYLAYGVGGSQRAGDAKDTINPFKKTTIGGKEVSMFNAFDWGLQFGAGVEYKRIMLTLGTQVGLYDITPIELFGQSVGTKNANTSFFVTAGYRF